MTRKPELYSINDPEQGLFRKLAEGMTTRIFAGEQSMLSIVTIDPEAMGSMHSHPEEQWGYVLEGNATRYEDDIEFEIIQGDIFRTPPHAKHTMKAGPIGIRVLDIFAPVRKEYLEAGEGFASEKS